MLQPTAPGTPLPPEAVGPLEATIAADMSEGCKGATANGGWGCKCKRASYPGRLTCFGYVLAL